MSLTFGELKEKKGYGLTLCFSLYYIKIFHTKITCLLLHLYYLLLVKHYLSYAIQSKKKKLKRKPCSSTESDFTAVLKWSPAALREPMSQPAGEAPSEDKIVGMCPQYSKWILTESCAYIYEPAFVFRQAKTAMPLSRKHLKGLDSVWKRTCTDSILLSRYLLRNEGQNKHPIAFKHEQWS